MRERKKKKRLCEYQATSSAASHWFSEESASRYHTVEICVTRRPATVRVSGVALRARWSLEDDEKQIRWRRQITSNGAPGPQPWLFLTTRRRGRQKVRERGWVDEVLRTNGDKKDNVDLAKEEAPLPAGKMLLSTLAPVWRICNPPQRRKAGARWKLKLAMVTGTGNMRR
jgi:hypothetical protein